MAQLYDTIGTHYAKYRRPDPRIGAAKTELDLGYRLVIGETA